MKDRELSFICRGLVRGLEIALIVVMGGLVLDVVWQVITRWISREFAWFPTSSWTEELATILLIWGALLGAAVGFARQSHLGVDYFVSKLSPSSRAATEIYSHLIVALFAGLVMIGGGIHLVRGTLATNQVSPALGWKMGYVYLALPISGLFILLISLDFLVQSGFDGRRDSQEHSVEGNE